MKNTGKIAVFAVFVLFASAQLLCFGQTSPSNDGPLLHQWFIKNGIFFKGRAFNWNTAWSNRNRDVPRGTAVFSGRRLTRLSLRNVNQSRLDLSDFANLERLEFTHSRLSDLQALEVPASMTELVFSSLKGLETVDLQGFTTVKTLKMERSNLSAGKLRKLPGGLVELNLGGNPDLKNINPDSLLKLKRLYLSECGFNELPEKKLPPSLEVLDLSGNKNLTGVRLPYLKNLSLLDLRDCRISDLESSSFPGSLRTLVLCQNPVRTIDLSSLQNLEILDLSYCKLEKIDAAALPLSLKELHLSFNGELKSIDLQGLTNLKKLFIYGSDPDRLQIHRLTGLEELCLSHYKKTYSIDFSKFRRLKRLTLKQCGLHMVEKLKLPVSLVHLDISGNDHLESANLGHLKNLRFLNLSHSGLRELNSSRLPASLEELDLNNTLLKKVNVRRLNKLKLLNLSGCDIRGVQAGDLPMSLTHLALGDNSSLETVHIRGLLKLRKLVLRDSNITRLELTRLPVLEELDISGNRNAGSFDLKELRRLKRLNASDCDVRDLKTCRLPDSIEELELGENRELETVELIDYPKLKKVGLYRCDLTRVSLEKTPELTELYLGGNLNLEKLEPADFPRLRILDLNRCDIKKFKLSGAPELQVLDLEDNRSLGTISLPALPELQLLRLSRSDLWGLSLRETPGLMMLDLSYSPRLSRLDVSGSRNLKILTLRGCEQPALFVALKVPDSVEELDIVPTPGVSRLNFRHLEKLKTLKVNEQSKTLKEVLLHPRNRAYPGIARIKYTWDEKKQQLSEEFQDDRGGLVLHPARKYAQKITPYRNGIPQEPDELNVEQAERRKKENAPWKGWTIIAALASSTLGYFLVGLILLQVYPLNKKLQTKLKNTGWGIFFAPSIKFYIHFGRRVRFKLLSPFIKDTLTADARLHVFKKEKYYPGSDIWTIIDAKRTDSHPITEAIREVKGTMILEGQSGLGKSMFSKWLLTGLIAQSKKRKQAPVFLLAGNCKTGVIPAIKDKLASSLFSKEEEIRHLVNERVLTVFIDGLNEAGAEVRESISRFVKEYRKSNIFITTQLIRWSKHKETRVYEIKPLEKEQIEEFLALKGETFNYNAVQLEDYKRRCGEWAELNRHKLVDQHVAGVLSNPMNLRIIAQLLHQGNKPTEIHLSDFFRQLFDTMNEKYGERFSGKPFQLKQMAKKIVEWALKEGDYLYLEKDIYENFPPEIKIMLEFKVLTEQDGKYEFSHDKFKTFFLLTHILETETWANPEYIVNMRFNDVYLDLARQLPIDTAEELMEQIYLSGTDISNIFMDEYYRVLARRPDYEKR